MFEDLFGNKDIEKIFFFLLINKKCYAGGLATNFGTSVAGFQRTLQKLERAGVLINYLEGRTRVYTFNPRYPFKNELENFFRKAYEYLPSKMKNAYYQKIERKRPRRTGKPL